MRMTADVFLNTKHARRQGTLSLKYRKKKTANLKFSTQKKCLPETKTKYFADTRKLEERPISRPAL